MALQVLTDCYNAVIGATAIARTARFERQTTQADIVSEGDGAVYAIDDGPWDIRGTLESQDPLIVPTIAGLTFPLGVAATGRIKNSTSPVTLGIANGMLIGVTMDLIDQQAGRARFEFQNRAATQVLATEASTIAGAARSLVDRVGVIRILAASCTFTPVGGAPITLLGLESVNWSARADVQAKAQPGSDFIDLLDVLDWRITGTMSIIDKQQTSSLTRCQYLATLRRGTLGVTCRAAGQADAASPPANKVVTLNYVKFKDPREGLNSKGDATGQLTFNALVRNRTLAQMISIADA